MYNKVREMLSRKKRLLILGPAFRRRQEESPLSALERYDGLFYRVARKYLDNVKDVDILVMKDDLTLIDSSTRLPFSKPEGTSWGIQTISKEIIEKARRVNESYLKKKLGKKEYSEIFISMGKACASALPDAVLRDPRTIFPSHGGPGPKALALKNWMKN
jgi:hypothetical protein